MSMPSDSAREQAGHVSRAFDDWRATERDQRTFLGLGFRFARAAYDRMWEETGREPAEDDGLEVADVFHRKVDGLWPQDYEWMLAAGVVKDAVTAYEVYCEKAREELLERRGTPEDVRERSPHWEVLVRFFRALGIDIEPPAVGEVRDLRHLLTHRRGELRTEALRRRYASDEPFAPIVVELSEARASAAMDILADAVRTIDRTVWEHAWEGDPTA